MLQVILPNTKADLEKQRTALKIALRQDTRKKDRQIHQQALEETEEALREIEGR